MQQFIIAIYIDNILIAILSIKNCNVIIDQLFHMIEVVNNSEIKSLLSLNIIRNYLIYTVMVSQPSYIDRLLVKFNLTNAIFTPTPFISDTKLKAAMANDSLYNAKLYQELTDSLNHFAVFSQLDILFTISKLSKYNANPMITYFKTILHILHYFKVTY